MILAKIFCVTSQKHHQDLIEIQRSIYLDDTNRTLNSSASLCFIWV